MAPPQNEPIEDSEDEDLDISDGDDMNELATFEVEELTQHHWHRRSMRDLIELMSTPWLDLNPDYQRDVVWYPDRMTKLINSLMSGYYVPPLIFNVITTKTETGGERYVRVSVDGKQRLSSVREFVIGNIPCTDKHGRRWYFCDNGDTSRIKKRVLPEKIKRKFMDLEFLCAEYSGLDRKQEEDLFSRVQMGVPLTPAEKLRASSGPWQTFAIEIERTYGELMNTIDNRRGRSFQLILQIFRQLVNADDSYPKYSSRASTLKAFCDRSQFLDESFKLTIRRVFHTYNEIVKEHPDVFRNHNYSHATKYAPIEFVGAAVLIHRHPERNVALLGKDLLALRSHLRGERQDLRSNPSTFNTIMGFIDNLEIHRGGSGVTKVVDNFLTGDRRSIRSNPVGSAIIETELAPTATKNSALIRKVPPSNDDDPDDISFSLPRPPEILAKIKQEKTAEPARLVYPKFPPPSLVPVTFTNTLPTSPTSQPQLLSSSQVRASVAPMVNTTFVDRFRAVRTNPVRWSAEGERMTKRSRADGHEEEAKKIGPSSTDYCRVSGSRYDIS